MKKIIFVFILLTVISLSEVKFRDMPLNHWARPYVEEISGLGIITGYEDNTFRGKATINRYDLAVFIAKYNRYMEDKYNLFLAVLGESVPKEENSRSRISEKVDLLEEIEDELWSLRNDFRLIEKKVNSESPNNKYLISFSLDSLVAVDYKKSDVLRSTGKLIFQKDIDNLNFGLKLIAGDINTDKDYSAIELALSGLYNFPVVGNVSLGLTKGPGELLSSFGEVIPCERDKLTLKTELIPIGFKFLPTIASKNVLGLSFKESYAFSKMIVSIAWNKSYLYRNTMVNLVKENGILDNKDTLELSAELNEFKLINQWAMGVNNNASYLIQFSFPSLKDSIVTIKKYSSQANAYQSEMGDTYTAMRAIDIYNEPIQSGSNYIGLEVQNFFNLLYGAVDLKSYQNSNYYKLKTGIKIKINNNLTIIKEGRYSSDPFNGKDIAALLYLNLNI